MDPNNGCDGPCSGRVLNTLLNSISRNLQCLERGDQSGGCTPVTKSPATKFIILTRKEENSAILTASSENKTTEEEKCCSKDKKRKTRK
jgi:hypothetical protein